MKITKDMTKENHDGITTSQVEHNLQYFWSTLGHSLGIYLDHQKLSDCLKKVPIAQW